jgi:hypothetical protein
MGYKNLALSLHVFQNMAIENLQKSTFSFEKTSRIKKIG